MIVFLLHILAFLETLVVANQIPCTACISISLKPSMGNAHWGIQNLLSLISMGSTLMMNHLMLSEVMRRLLKTLALKNQVVIK